MAAHTPVPWHRRVGREGNGFAISQHEQICNDRGYAVVILEHDGSTEGGANAEFIVRACNGHEDLVAAIEGLLTTRAGNSAQRNRAIAEAEVVLAKASGK